jgi:hypothetical protein
MKINHRTPRRRAGDFFLHLKPHQPVNDPGVST